MYVMYACVRVCRVSVCPFDSEECSACAHWRFRKKTYKTDIMDTHAHTRTRYEREKKPTQTGSIEQVFELDTISRSILT